MKFHFNKVIKIGRKNIGENKPSFIVAEISANHSQNLEKAKKLLILAKKSGADAVKIQTYKPESISIKGIKDLKKNKTWKKYNSRFELFSKTFLPWEWHQDLFNLAKKNNLEIFSSPFDIKSVKFLDKFNPVAYKIASPEINDFPLIEEIAKRNKPVIASLGCAEKKDIKNVIKIMTKYKNNKLILLKCIADYPTNPKFLNLKTINFLKKTYNCLVGLSDHTLSIGPPIASIMLGGCMVEKHIKLHNDKKSIDSFFSIDNYNFKIMSKSIRDAEASVGRTTLNLGPNHKKHLNSKRSIYAIRDIQIGERFTKNNIQITRPGNTLHPKFFKSLIGKISKKKIKLGMPIKLNFIK